MPTDTDRLHPDKNEERAEMMTENDFDFLEKIQQVLSTVIKTRNNSDPRIHEIRSAWLSKGLSALQMLVHALEEEENR
jgi:predicted house-cleaning noncanonical NTP pyrophosphatase (MazG superfamily)